MNKKKLIFTFLAIFMSLQTNVFPKIYFITLSKLESYSINDTAVATFSAPTKFCANLTLAGSIENALILFNGMKVVRFCSLHFCKINLAVSLVSVTT